VEVEQPTSTKDEIDEIKFSIAGKASIHSSNNNKENTTSKTTNQPTYDQK
jgi:hypothetical protein